MSTINIAIIGLGRLGMCHAEHVASMPKVKLKAAFALDDEQLDLAHSRFGAKPYKDWRMMINQENLDAIIIAAPTAFHPEITIYAIEHGLNVFCEKPMGIDMEEIEQMVTTIKSRPEQIFQLGFMRRFDPSYQEAKRMVISQELGDILYMRGYGSDPFKNLKSFVNYAGSNDSGGIFLDMTIHDIDLVRWIVGKEPVEVYAVGNSLAAPELQKMGEFETGVANLRFDNDMVATLVAGRTAAHGNHVEFEIMGSKGWIRVGQEASPYYTTLFTDKGIVRPCMQSFPERFSEAFKAELQAFIYAVSSGKPNTVAAEVEDGRAASKIARACQESAKHHHIVKL